MKKWHWYLLMFVLMVALGGGIAYMEGGQNPSAFPEDCAAYCKPRKGVLEKQGATVGPDWRYDGRNVKCVCK
jgi:hypothetical protein